MGGNKLFTARNLKNCENESNLDGRFTAAQRIELQNSQR